MKRLSSHAAFEQAVDAIVDGDVTTLKRLLQHYPGIARMRSRRKHRATLLIYVGANGVENDRQKTPPHAVEIARLLLAAGSEIDAVADLYGGATTLGLVATSVFPKQAGLQNSLMSILLKSGADLNHPGAAGNRHCIVNGCLANGRPAAAEFLARRGAQLDLEGAAGVGNLAAVRACFDRNGRLKKTATRAQMYSGFNWACAYGRRKVAEFLLDRGLNPSKIHRGETGLHWAAYGGHLDIVKRLLKRGARADVRDEKWNSTPMGWALQGRYYPSPDFKHPRHPDVVRQLVQAGAPIHPCWRRKLRADPLMGAALRGKAVVWEARP